MKKVLILGSNSFAGSDFVDFLLTKKIKVFGASRSKEPADVYLKYKKNKNIKNFKFYQVNLNLIKDIKKVIEIIKKEKIKYVVNFAAQGMVAESWVKPEDWYKTNVISNSILVKHLTKVKLKKFLNFSTPEVYGHTPKLKKECDIFKPTTPYAISRATQDLNLIAYNKTFNFPVVFTRTANIFGPHQQVYRIVPKIIISILLGKKIPIHGKGNTLRSFIFMSDVSRALYNILVDKKNIGQTFHISTEKFVTILQLVNIVKKIMKIKKNIIYFTKERDGKDFKYLLNSKKIRKEYRWKEEINLENGIEQTMSWLEKNIKYFKKEKLYYIHKK